MSSTELLTAELAAVKLTDSKENLVEEQEVVVVAVAVVEAEAEEQLSASLSEVNKSTGSLNKLNRSNSKLGLDSTTATEDVAKKSTEELVAVSLDEPKVNETEIETETQVKEEASGGVDESEEVAKDEIAEDESEKSKKKCCALQKAAKCRCIIS